MRIHIVATAAGRDLLGEHFDLETIETPNDLAGKVLLVARSAAEHAKGEIAQIDLQYGTDPRQTTWTGTAQTAAEGILITNTESLSDAACALVERQEVTA